MAPEETKRLEIDEPYDWVRVRKIGQHGRSVSVWVRSPLTMGLPRNYLNAAIYLYETEGAAKQENRAGGSGFMVSYPYADNKDQFHYYYVTNRHVIFDKHAPIVRINSEGEGVCIISYLESDWTPHPDGDDIAVAIARLSPAADIAHVSTSQFVTEENRESLSVGAGDPVYMIGRFVDHPGTGRNLAAVRFGNIAMGPEEKIEIRVNGEPILVDVYLVDMRSRFGFSGSPTYVMVANYHPVFPSQQTYLLGVEFADWPEPLKLQSEEEPHPPEHWYVEAASGLCCVSPAWRLLGLLNSEGLAEQRRIAEKQYHADFVAKKSPRNN